MTIIFGPETPSDFRYGSLGKMSALRQFLNRWLSQDFMGGFFQKQEIGLEMVDPLRHSSCSS
jgi:hypothetical protein